MSTYIIHNGELCHYGVPGMKWGIRKARQEAKANYKAAKKKALSKYYNTTEKIDEKYELKDFTKGGKGYSKADKAAMDKADAKYKSDISKAKTEYKSAKAAATKKHHDVWDKAETRALRNYYDRDSRAIHAAHHKGKTIASGLLRGAIGGTTMAVATYWHKPIANGKHAVKILATGALAGATYGAINAAAAIKAGNRAFNKHTREKDYND